MKPNPLTNIYKLHPKIAVRGLDKLLLKLKFFKILLFLCFGLVGSSQSTFAIGHYPPPSSNYLDSVDYYLKEAYTSSQRAMTGIKTELQNLDNLPVDQRLESLARIGKQLERISVDSAMMVYVEAEKLARESNNERYIRKFHYRRGSVMPMMGLVREGIELYNSVTPDMVDPQDKFDYFTTGHHIFDAAVDYYHVDSLKQKYNHKSIEYTDSILHYVKPGSVEHLYYTALPKLSRQDRQVGIEELMEVLQRVPITDPLFAVAAAEIANTYMSISEMNKARYFFALSAISDLKAGTRETTSLHRLGKILNNHEDYSRAYDYLAYALESAVASGSNLRTIEIGEIMPDVVKAGRQIERKRNSGLVAFATFLSIALIILALVLIYTFRTRNRLTHARTKLLEINNSKDLYIRKLMALCGAYLAALENFNKLAGRKIKVGQVNDLLTMIESGRVIREQLQAFFEVFDDAFLSIYPDFVDRVNDLLLPDKKLSLTDDGQLGPELRIVAFMRLGMDDSNQIAKFLGLSLNTIYTYRNKVKSRAINRQEFEENIRNIGRNPE